MKELDEIRELLKLFYEGETSTEQEHRLSEFFKAATDLPEDLKSSQKVFDAIVRAGEAIAIPEGLEGRLTDALDAEIGKDMRRKVLMSKFRKFVAVAACSVAILIAGWQIQLPQEHLGEVTDPAIAQAETKKALMMLSRELNRADEPLAKANAVAIKLEKQQMEILKNISI